jgi:integrase
MAERKFQALRKQILSGVNIDGSKQLLSEWLPYYIDNEVARYRKRATAHDYTKRADYFILPTLGEYRLCDLTRHICLAWVNAVVDYRSVKGKPWSLTSIKQARNLLNRALDAAVAERYLEYNPMSSVKVPDRRIGDELVIEDKGPQQKAFTPEQQEAFLEEVLRTNDRHGFYAYYLLAAELGWRRGEGLGIRLKDVDFDQLTISINQQVIRLDSEKLVTTPKTLSSQRALPITQDLAAVLQEQCKRVGATGPDDLLFPNKQGQPRQPNGVTQHVRRVCKRLGFEGFNLHSLRKTAITNWRRNGVDLEVAGALAGHKGVKVTAEVYSDPQMDRKRAAIEKKGKATE